MLLHRGLKYWPPKIHTYFSLFANHRNNFISWTFASYFPFLHGQHSSLEPVRPALAHRQALVTVPGQVTCSGLAAARLRGKANPHVQICKLLLQGLTLGMLFRFSWDWNKLNALVFSKEAVSHPEDVEEFREDPKVPQESWFPGSFRGLLWHTFKIHPPNLSCSSFKSCRLILLSWNMGLT